jgi:hypothetical protein
LSQTLTRAVAPSIFRDKNRRHIGKSQSKQPQKRTQRPAHHRSPLLLSHVEPLGSFGPGTRCAGRVGECPNLAGRPHILNFVTRTGVAQAKSQPNSWTECKRETPGSLLPAGAVGAAGEAVVLRRPRLREPVLARRAGPGRLGGEVGPQLVRVRVRALDRQHAAAGLPQQIGGAFPPGQAFPYPQFRDKNRRGIGESQSK